jgi:hypothetical protein
MKAAVATIGIRGTDYALELSDKLVGNVAEGAIEVCNGAGCLSVLAGQAFLVPSLTEIPVLSERHVFLPPTQPRESGRAPTQREAAADDQRPNDAAVLEQDASENAKKNAALERALAPAALDATAIAGSDKSVSNPGKGAAIGSAVNPVGAVAVPPGQAKKSGVDDVLLVLPAPATSPSVPPGQLKKPDAGVLDAVTTNPGKGAGPPGGIPPGQAKR